MEKISKTDQIVKKIEEQVEIAVDYCVLPCVLPYQTSESNGAEK